MVKRIFHFNKYASKLCKKIGLDLRKDTITVKFQSNIERSYDYVVFVGLAIACNWDPAYNENALGIISDNTSLNNFINDVVIKAGIPHDYMILKYLEFAKHCFNCGFFISDLFYAEYLENKVKIVARTDAPVTVFGEPGVGKQPIAYLIHSMSKRSEAPFETIDCSELNDDQMCSTVFGLSKNNNTTGNIALLTQANGGTLYIKNLQNSGLNFQKRLSQLIEDNSYASADDGKIEHANVRFIFSIELDTDKSFPDHIQGMNIQLFYAIMKYHLHLLPCRKVRNEIPMKIFFAIEESSNILRRKVRKGSDLLTIPDFLVKNWLVKEDWVNNYHHLNYTVDYFVKEYFRIKQMGDIYFKKKKGYLGHSFAIKGKSEIYYVSDGIEARNNFAFHHHMESIPDTIHINGPKKPRTVQTNLHYQFDLLLNPFLQLALKGIDFEEYPKNDISYSDYIKLSPYQNGLTIGYNRKILGIEFSKKHIDQSILGFSKQITKINVIKRIVVEIDEKGEKYPNINFYQHDDSEPIELVYNPKNQLPQVSFLLFLIYERSNIDKDGNARNPDWGLNWLEKRDDLNFKPLIDVCRWFKFIDEKGQIKPPSWWQSPFNTYPMITKIREILTANDIDRKFIKPDSFRRKKAIYHIDKDIKADLRIK